MISKPDLIADIKLAKNQKTIHSLLAKAFDRQETFYIQANGTKKVTDTVNDAETELATTYDSNYHVGKSHALASDGKYHDFGNGKWNVTGDNIPESLSVAKERAIATAHFVYSYRLVRA